MFLRNIVEHMAHPDILDPEQKYLNSIHCGLVEAYILGPYGFNFHAEHHLFPTIPSPRLYRIIHRLKNIPYFKENIVVYPSYFFPLSQIARGHYDRTPH